MAFTVSSQNPTQIINKGIEHAPRMYVGVVALSTGTATVTIPGARRIIHAAASSQTANAARVSATSTNTFTITGTDSDVVSYIAVAD